MATKKNELNIPFGVAKSNLKSLEAILPKVRIRAYLEKIFPFPY
jgi:hypothetical protein